MMVRPAVFLWLALAIVPRPANAQEVGDLLGEADALWGRDDFAAACLLYARAHQRDPTHRGALNRHAECKEKEGELLVALSLTRELLGRELGPQSRQTVEEREKRLLARLARIVVDAPGSLGCRVRDERTTDTVVLPGLVQVCCSFEAGEQCREVSAEAGKSQRVELRSTNATRDEVRTPPRIPRAQEEPAGVDDGLLYGGIASTAIGAAGLVVAAVTGGLVLEQQAIFDEGCETGRCSQDALDAADTLNALNLTGFIVGGVGLAVGIPLIAVGSSQGSSSATLNVTASSVHLEFGF